MTNVSRDLAASMETMVIDQVGIYHLQVLILTIYHRVEVTLVSREEELHSVQSSSLACRVARGQAASLLLTTTTATTVEDKWRDVDRCH